MKLRMARKRMMPRRMRKRVLHEWLREGRRATTRPVM
jgi:hypothetical protein